MTTLTAATFTLFYSLMWGKEIAEQWLASILISFGQDIFVVQPTEVMFTVVMVSLLLTRTKCAREDLDAGRHRAYDRKTDIDFVSDNPKAQFKRENLEAIRKRRKKEIQLPVMIRDIVYHLIYVFFLAIVTYGNKNGSRFLMTIHS